MNHSVFRQRWEKPLEENVVEVVHSIHLSEQSAQAFVEKEKARPTFPGYEPVGHLGFDLVNDEIYNHLQNSQGIWTEDH